MRRSAVAAVATAVTSGLLAAFAPATASASDLDVIGYQGTLTQRIVSPITGAPSQQIASADVYQDKADWKVTGTVTLRAAEGPEAEVWVAFGNMVDGRCHEARRFSSATADPGEFTRSGATVSFDVDTTAAFTEDWDCAGAFTGPGSGPYDGVMGSLTAVYGQPVLAIESVELLGKKTNKLKLVKGDWTTLEVTVNNSASYNAPALRVTGSGKGLKVKPATYEVVYRNGGKGTVRIPVKLTGKRKKTTLRLTAASRDASATRAIKVKRVKPARKPADGRYRAKVKGSKAKVTFRIRKGRVTGFKGTGFRMRCQTPGDYATYQTVGLNYPKKVKISRAGLVDATHRWRKGNAWYNAWLQMRVAGAKVKQGNFTYVTANWCSVDVDFTARRVGR